MICGEICTGLAIVCFIVSGLRFSDRELQLPWTDPSVKKEAAIVRVTSAAITALCEGTGLCMPFRLPCCGADRSLPACCTYSTSTYETGMCTLLRVRACSNRGKISALDFGFVLAEFPHVHPVIVGHAGTPQAGNPLTRFPLHMR